MKILIFQNYITNQKVLDAGIELLKQNLDSIGFPYSISSQKIAQSFNPLPVTSDVVVNGYMVNPNEIGMLAGKNPGYDLYALIFDAARMLPRPTNPVDNGGLMQMSCQWFNDKPEVFADYFLHELSHFLFTRSHTKDITHLVANRDIDPALYDKWISTATSHTPFYLYLITQNKAFWGTVPVTDTTTTTPTLKQGAKGDSVKSLQTLLGIKVDGDFGGKTKQAVIDFQKIRGLVADGIVGAKTWDELKKKPYAILTRIKDTGKETLGELTAFNGTKVFTCKTMELPWKENKRMISCVPTGIYDVVRTKWVAKGKFSYLLQKVLNRTGIFMHEGNYYFNYEGCIGLGKDFAEMNKDGQMDITDTLATVKAFETFMENKDFTLTIK